MRRQQFLSLTFSSLFPLPSFCVQGINNQEPLGPSQVIMGFAEAVGDLSNSIGYMWLAPSDNPQLLLRYRAQGTTTWQDAPCWTGGFWTRTERVHRARLTGLQPDTVYELRPWGAPLSDIRRIRTAPAGEYEPRLIHLADYQTNNYAAGAPFDAMNAVVAQHLDDVHLLVGGGDYVNDDGYRERTQADRWWSFLTNIHTHFKRSDGTLVPWVWLAGNHESYVNYANVADPANPISPPGWLPFLFQFLWDQSLPNSPLPGHGWLKFGSNLLLVFLDTNHTSYLTDQLDSFKAILTQHAPTVRHVCIVSHVSPWRGQNTTDAWAAHRQLRREFLPFAQEFSNLKFWLTGHEHNFAVTYSIRAVPETGNEYKWVRDEERGVVFTGHGGWATASTRGLANVALASPVDGSLMYESYIMRRSSDLALVIHNIENSPSTPSSGANSYSEAYHFWKLEFSRTSAKAIAYSNIGSVYKTVTRTLSSLSPTKISAPPSVNIRRTHNSVEVEFEGILQYSPDLATPFVDIPNATSPFRIPPEWQRGFFRARL